VIVDSNELENHDLSFITNNDADSYVRGLKTIESAVDYKEVFSDLRPELVKILESLV
jgi:hypothetical protein